MGSLKGSQEAPIADEEPISLIISFQNLPDPRVEGRCDHKLLDIIVIAVCAVLAGAETWVEVEQFGKARQVWLARLLELWDRYSTGAPPRLRQSTAQSRIIKRA